MSMRPMIYPIHSIDPVRRMLGSGDQSHIEPLLASFKQVRGGNPEMLDAFRERVEDFLAGELREGKERGEWERPIYFAAHALGLLEGELPINEDWSWGAWADYFDEVENRLPVHAQELLRALVFGRGLNAAGVDCPGAYYAWLDAEEVKQLLAALNELKAADPDIVDAIDGFHDDLAHWLARCGDGTCLLLAS